MKRRSGMLLPVSSLPSKYGIGTFSKEAYAFVDLLDESGQSLWQVLPIGPTGYGDSPYQSFSTFAGNPYFIDLEQLISEGLLTTEECDSYDWGDQQDAVAYDKIYQSRFKVLKIAYERCPVEKRDGIRKFYDKNSFWLKDYALFMALKDHFGGQCWTEWPDAIRMRKEDAVAAYEKELADDMGFYIFLQYLFRMQWQTLKQYANDRNIKIIGDIPIYVSFDSVEVWAHPELFQLDENHMPLAVAGCPPDAFSADGQLWGNPLYAWDYHKSTGYEWWISRMRALFELFDIVRIDHFRGFDAYYSIPYGDKTAANGHWEEGVGVDLFNHIKAALGDAEIIAEDLGYVTDSVKQLLEDTGYPGMKVLQFAFDSREAGDYMPHGYPRNCVVYTGTHDNDTIVGWYNQFSEEDKKVAMAYLNNYHTPAEEIQWDYISCAMRTVADTCIIPVQDYLGLGGEARMNTPSVPSGNWKWRMHKDAFTPEIKEKIHFLTKICDRC